MNISRYLEELQTKNKLILLTCIGFLVYANSLFNNFVLDDYELLVNNTLVHSFSIGSFFTGSIWNAGGTSTLAGNYYRPLVSLSLSVVYLMFGLNTFPYHLLQVSLHVANGILLYLILKRFFKDPFSFFAGVLFLVHPINVEAVSYTASIGDVLYVFFGLLALYLADFEKISNKKLYAIYFLLLCSLLSKETGIVFLIGVSAVLIQRKYFSKLKLQAIFCLIIYFLLRFGIAHIGSPGCKCYPLMQASLLQRIFTIPSAFFYYLKTFFFPKDLIVAQNWVVQNPTLSSFYLPLIFSVGVFAIVLWFAYYLFHKHSEYLFPYLVGLFFFFFGLAPVMQFTPLTSTVADRWFYLPLIGVIFALGAFYSSFHYSKKQVLCGIFLVIFVITLFSFRTIIRNFDYQNEYTLSSHDLSYSENNFLLQNSLGYQLMLQNKLSDAEMHLKKSTQLAPYYFINWNNLGAVETRIAITNNDGKKLNEAISDYHRSIDNGDYYLAYENLAALLYFYKDPQTTKALVLKGIQKLPYNSKLWLILGLSEYKLGEKEQALLAVSNSYKLSSASLAAVIYQSIEQGKPVNLRPSSSD